MGIEAEAIPRDCRAYGITALAPDAVYMYKHTRYMYKHARQGSPRRQTAAIQVLRRSGQQHRPAAVGLPSGADIRRDVRVSRGRGAE